MVKSYKGRFTPTNPQKYAGNPRTIVYRSGYELKYMKYLDSNPAIIKWLSETIAIPYMSPVDQRAHRYFPDFVVQFRDKEGKTHVWMVEIKPSKQTKAPKVGKKVSNKNLMEAATYAVNTAKWKAANEYCKKKGWSFKIMTEKELGIE